MDQHAVPQPIGGGADERKAFAIERSVRQGFPFFPLSYILALETLLRRLRDEGARPALRGITLTGSVRAKISAFADDITVFVSHRLDIVAVKMVVDWYEKVAGATVKSKVLRLGAWKEGAPLPGPFRWSDGPVRILGLWFGPGFQLERNWLEVRAKVEVEVAIWLRRRLSLKGRVEVCAVYIFPLILYCLYSLCLRIIGWRWKQSFFNLLWKGRSPLVRRQVCCQGPHDWEPGDVGSREPLARQETGLPRPVVHD